MNTILAPPSPSTLHPTNTRCSTTPPHFLPTQSIAPLHHTNTEYSTTPPHFLPPQSVAPAKTAGCPVPGPPATIRLALTIAVKANPPTLPCCPASPRLLRTTRQRVLSPPLTHYPTQPPLYPICPRLNPLQPLKHIDTSMMILIHQVFIVLLYILFIFR